MVNEILQFLRTTFSPEIGVLLAGAIPITELRAAIPLAVSIGMPSSQAFFFAVLGNLLPIPILLLVLPKALGWFSKGTWIGRKLDWWVERTRKRSDKVEKYGALGLVLFTAIPLPTTGAWSASLAAVIFKIPTRLALVSISLGVIIAGVIITLLSVGIMR